MANCCSDNRPPQKSFWSGILYGLVPHTFCIAFFVLSLVGAVGSATLAKKFLLIPHFFLILTIISLSFATLAAFLYLKKNNSCSISGIKKRRRYLITLFATTIATNLLVAYIIVPAFINKPVKALSQDEKQLLIAAEVQIPCPGHAPLVISELEKASGIETVTFKLPRTFEITYNPETTSPQTIAALDIFKTFKLQYN
jgi:hypothetical protein